MRTEAQLNGQPSDQQIPSISNGQPDAFVVYYQNRAYDLSRFAHKHPGGRNTLAGLHGLDMERRLRSAPAHSAAAMYLLREYQLNAIDDVNNNENNRTAPIDSRKSSTQTNNPTTDVNGDSDWRNSSTDESMEHLVDWSSAMLPQIGQLGHRYTEWVNKPVDRPLRLFRSDWLEILTQTPWWLVPAFWLPAILLILRTGIERATPQSATSTMAGHYVTGLLLWTVIEYALHRWVFHMDTHEASPGWCTVHFVLHGLHHKVPFDPYRLVFPPAPACVLAALFYLPILAVSRCPELMLAGGLSGYVCYDMIHYYIHYGSPAGNGYMYNLKRYHYQHHFVHHDRGFGISSPMWDDVFGTRIVLRTLKYLLRW